MKYIKYILISSMVVFTGCTLDEIQNPNSPSEETFAENASQADIQLLAVGLEAVMRNDIAFHYNSVSILAREYYDLSGVDPRYTGELLKGPLDNNGFLTTRAFAAWYKVVKSANLLVPAVENSLAGFSDETKNGYYGFAKTLKAYALLMVANRNYTNGIRIDVEDPDNLGPIVSYENALSEIMDLLNEANSNLASAGGSFDFNTTLGFDTPSDFSKFNRAIAARVALYQGDNQQALSMLSNSFFDLNGDLWTGATHVFGLTGNDLQNTLFHVLNQSGQEFMIHDSWINDAEAGDLRVAEKSNLFDGGTVLFDGLTADYQIALYDSNVDPIYLIRNEELILIYAEAQIGLDNNQAVAAINVVRNAAGIGDYSGDTDNNSLIEEVLKQRRYSLLGEGHRWIDLRRLNRLNENYVPLDRTGDNIIDAFPTPFTEGL
ncbi:RagB/SusD family nutrient uptake outer membrane protein [Halomarinibacterium sedimenti]|uniref:RagB/SusD family nutrient uptake outer membrane protein n=1 Tax=Halomarinibacterium sedimenti TaxID=2857106 RepID=UPI0021072A03|nr:RagB/SusD family nutrient uptake outer membrane protein [Halomarinibacterium sedimenti]